MIERNKSNPDLLENEPWICRKCTIIENIQIFPYGLLNDADIININSSSSMRVLDVNIPGNINCK